MNSSASSCRQKKKRKKGLGTYSKKINGVRRGPRWYHGKEKLKLEPETGPCGGHAGRRNSRRGSEAEDTPKGNTIKKIQKPSTRADPKNKTTGELPGQKDAQNNG